MCIKSILTQAFHIKAFSMVASAIKIAKLTLQIILDNNHVWLDFFVHNNDHNKDSLSQFHPICITIYRLTRCPLTPFEFCIQVARSFETMLEIPSLCSNYEN